MQTIHQSDCYKFCNYRILLEKRQAQDAMELLKLYHQSVANGTEDVSPPKQERV